ncbi:MAG: hypothetical protein CK426_04345 [Legionella sp.]|nr:MAG: hypothetical protein CK423_03595 [Legionella sp.]PJD98917.1 MAG: hypothetical protein CK426_04345 [Legionella sp.]
MPLMPLDGVMRNLSAYSSQAQANYIPSRTRLPLTVLANAINANNDQAGRHHLGKSVETLNRLYRHGLSMSSIEAVSALLDTHLPWETEEQQSIRSFENIQREESQSRRSPELDNNNTSFLGLMRGGFFSRPAAQANPQEGINNFKLEEINYQGSIPENYRCPLSYCIMSNPVFVASHPNQRYERSWIVHHIAKSHNNPLTREPLNVSQLVEDSQLKEEIDAFVEMQINASRLGLGG